MPDYLTTKEVAQLLRIKERKVYDLAASGKIPCSKAMGKLLFPKAAVDAWLVEGGLRNAGALNQRAARPNVFLGSHDPLLDWALRESQCGLATFFDGSADGLARFASGEGVAAGMHIHEPVTDTWNVDAVETLCADMPVVLVEWCRRQRGLIVRPEHATRVTGLGDLDGLTLVPRQAQAGAATLFTFMLEQAGVDARSLLLSSPARTETDAAAMVLDGKADAAFGLQAAASHYRLHFVPLIEERFDLLVDRKAWFNAPFQTFLAFWRTGLIEVRAREMTGYDMSGLGTVHFNGG